MRNYDQITSIIWLLIGLIFLIGGINLGIGQISSPGAGFIPALFGVLLILLSAVLFFLSFGVKKESGKKKFWKEEKSWEAFFSTLSSIVLYALLLNYLGYIMTTFFFLTYLIKFIGKKGWRQACILSFLGTSLSYVAFKIFFEVPLPKGMWGL